MTGHNVSLYLDDLGTWEKFRQACEMEKRRPNTVLRQFIENYCDEVLGREISLELKIAEGMVEAQKIAKGKKKGRDARKLLEEI